MSERMLAVMNKSRRIETCSSGFTGFRSGGAYRIRTDRSGSSICGRADGNCENRKYKNAENRQTKACLNEETVYVNADANGAVKAYNSFGLAEKVRERQKV